MNWLALLVPFAYLGILVASLGTFSSLYRKRKAAASLSLAPYFPPHPSRNIYLSLLHLSDDAETNEKTSKVPDSILRAALLARAQEDITRIIEIRTRKQALSTLLQRGVVGDEIWQRLLRAEQELEAEVKDVVGEANAFAPNWGQTIFQSASEMAANGVLKKKLATIADGVAAEREWWEAKRESTKEGFMRELDQDAAAAVAAAAEKKGQGQGPGQAGGPVATQGATATATTAAQAEKMVNGLSSDGSEEAVLVETPGQASVAAVAGGGGGGGGGKNKKKKGKK